MNNRQVVSLLVEAFSCTGSEWFSTRVVRKGTTEANVLESQFVYRRESLGTIPTLGCDQLSRIGPLIHIVDDDPSVARALKRLLNSWGMQVQTFTSGVEFLSAIGQSQDVDCSVIDVQMPGMTGLEVQENMNRAGVDVPVIFITAHEQEGMEERALEAGAIGFLRKPFTEEALVGLIRNALQRRPKT